MDTSTEMTTFIVTARGAAGGGALGGPGGGCCGGAGKPPGKIGGKDGSGGGAMGGHVGGGPEELGVIVSRIFSKICVCFFALGFIFLMQPLFKSVWTIHILLNQDGG